MSEISEAIKALMDEKGYSVDSVKRTIEDMLKASYKKAFGTDSNCIVKFEDDMSDVSVYSRKTILDGIYDPVTEIELEDALKLSSECEPGDEIDILIDPKKDFSIAAVTTGKQRAHQNLNESYKDRLYEEYKDKKGQIIIGYYQREYKGSVYVEIGNDVEGVLPFKFQNPVEHFEKDDRIKALVMDVRKTSSALQLVLSRIDPNLVKNILELEVPELADKTVEIKKIVRDAGYRTKIAVYTDHENVDPVGACVGMKGARIQNVIKEIDGEKIDVLRYDEDPTKFIANALSPAAVSRVIVTDAEKRSALAIVPDSQFSLAIGRQGHNVRLANRLCDWTIDVKTESQAAELDLSEFVTNVPLFNEIPAEDAIDGQEQAVSAERETEEPSEISVVSDISEIDGSVAEILKSSKYDDIQNFVDAYYDGSLLESGLLTKEQVESAFEIITKYVEIVDDDSEQPEE